MDRTHMFSSRSLQVCRRFADVSFSVMGDRHLRERFHSVFAIYLFCFLASPVPMKVFPYPVNMARTFPVVFSGPVIFSFSDVLTAYITS